jgi:hypothetical protein
MLRSVFDTGESTMNEPDVQATDSTVAEDAVVVLVENPHVLWKQILGLAIASLIMVFFGGPLLVITGILAFADAWVAGIYKRADSTSFVNISPMAWGIVIEGILIVGLPCYLAYRNKLKTKKGSTALFVLTIVFAAGTLALAALQLMMWFAAR